MEVTRSSPTMMQTSPMEHEAEEQSLDEVRPESSMSFSTVHQSAPSPTSLSSSPQEEPTLNVMTEASPPSLEPSSGELMKVENGVPTIIQPSQILTTTSGAHPVPFAKALYRMIKEHPDVISWESSTGSLIIPDPKKLEKTLLDYFRHGRYASFQRQLNNFGYRRVGSPGPATVYRRELAPGEQVPGGDIAPESILSLRHVLRRSAKPTRDELARRRGPVKLHHPRFSDPSAYPEVESPRSTNSDVSLNGGHGFSANSSQSSQLYDQHRVHPQPQPPQGRFSPKPSTTTNQLQSPALAAHALLSLKAQAA